MKQDRELELHRTVAGVGVVEGLQGNPVTAEHNLKAPHLSLHMETAFLKAHGP